MSARGRPLALVIDDDADVTLLCRIHLEQVGYDVLAAEAGLPGIALAREHVPTVIVLDFMLPDLDGIAVLEEIRADPITAQIPVVMLTARVHKRDEEAAWSAGASDFLTKPFDVRRLIASIEDVRTVSTPEAVDRRRQEAINRLRVGDVEILQQLAAIVEDSQDAIISKTLDGVVTTWNAAAEALYGYRAEEMIGRSVSVLAAPEAGDEIPELLRRVGRGEVIEHYEASRQRKDGSRVEVSLTVSPIKNPEGKVIGASVISRDISRRQQFEDTFRDLVEAAPDALVIIDEHGFIELVNAQTELLFGYSRTELIGQLVEILVPQRFRSSHPGNRAGYAARPRVRSMGAGLELFALRKDGTEFPVEISLSPINSRGGLKVSAAIRDVSERKRAETRFRSLLEAAPDAMVIVDDRGRITLVNTQTERLFGYDRADLIGHPVEVLVPKRFRAGHPKHRSGYTHAPRVRGMGAGVSLYGLRKDGSEFPVEISLSPLETEQGITVSAAIRDVTDRREAEEVQAMAYRRELEASERLREVDRLRSDFMATVSHELRTPLTAIKGFADLMVQAGGSMAEEQRADLIMRIARAGAKLDYLIADLLDFTRLERGQLEIRLERVELSELVHQTLQQAGGVTERHEVDVQVPAGLVTMVDAKAFARVLDNLLSNAAKFSPTGSTISVRGRQVEAGIELSVSDAGVGMASDELEHIFERFYRIGGPLNRQPGTGIGLAIVKEFIEAQHGRVTVDSTAGVGTTFTVHLLAAD